MTQQGNQLDLQWILQLFTEIVDAAVEQSTTKSSESLLESLPPELIETILSYLPLQDLGNIVLTSRHLLDIGGHPKFWTDAWIVNQRSLDTIFTIERYKSCLLYTSPSPRDS